MNIKQQDILETAALLFSHKGIKATTVDEIATNCGISKKTLYCYFQDKETIVSEMVKSVLIKTEQYISMLPDISANATSELVNFFQFMQGNVHVFTPLFIKELARFYPNVNKLIYHSRNTKFLPFFYKNIERGIFEGIYRKKLDSIIIGEMYFLQLDHALLDESALMSQRFHKLACINTFFLHGIVNERGAKLLLTSFN